MNRTARRISYIFLCTLPFLDLVVVGVRTLRIPGVYQVIGGVLFAVIVIAAWILGARVIGSGAAGGRRLALAGALLIVPFAIISLLWVGLGAPFQATMTENSIDGAVAERDVPLVAIPRGLVTGGCRLRASGASASLAVARWHRR
ncbi:MAG: hypothetical protein HY048_00200 [Acidobacteria bacterium]|nr:hypothetical protein [Acidobacteriota bacterium]